MRFGLVLVSAQNPMDPYPVNWKINFCCVTGSSNFRCFSYLGISSRCGCFFPSTRIENLLILLKPWYIRRSWRLVLYIWSRIFLFFHPAYRRGLAMRLPNGMDELLEVCKIYYRSESCLHGLIVKILSIVEYMFLESRT